MCTSGQTFGERNVAVHRMGVRHTVGTSHHLKSQGHPARVWIASTEFLALEHCTCIGNLQVPGLRNLDDLLGALDPEAQAFARSILDWAAYAAADQQTHHMVHFSWAPAAGVLHCLSHYIPPDSGQSFIHAAVSHLQTTVPVLVQRNASDLQHKMLGDAAAPVPQEAHDLNKLLTATEKVSSKRLAKEKKISS